MTHGDNIKITREGNMRTLILRNTKGQWIGDINQNRIEGFKATNGMLVLKLRNMPTRLIPGSFDQDRLAVAFKSYNRIDLNNFRNK